MIYRSTYTQDLDAPNYYHNYSFILQDDELMQDFDQYFAANQISIINEMDKFE